MKVTYKRHAKVGRYRSFELDYTDIKFKRKQIGSIVELRNPPVWQERYCIRFTIVSKVNPCGWRWVTVKQKFETEMQAREFLTPETVASFNRHSPFYFLEP